MGAVYEVENVFIGKRFALKVLNSQTDSAVRRFQIEAKAASRLDHINLLKVYDFGLLDGERPYLLMDLAHGVPLSSVITKKTLSFEAVLNIFRQICAGLNYAHSANVIHRDIKPSNIVVSDPDDLEHTNVVVIDFGIAKLTAQTPSANELTRTGEPIGTPYYMSPEQCMGQPIETSSDIYSVGCLLFECLTGSPPFLGESGLATMMMHQNDKPPTLKQATLGATFPRGTQLVIDKLLEKKPNRRYQNLTELVCDLERIDAGEPPQLGEHAKSPVPLGQKMPLWKWALTGLAGVLIVLNIGVLLHLFMPHPTPQSPPGEILGKAIIDSQPARILMHESVLENPTDIHEPAIVKRKTPFSSIIPGQPNSRLFQFPDDGQQVIAEFATLGYGTSIIYLEKNGAFIPLKNQMPGAPAIFSSHIQARGTFIIQNFQSMSVLPTQLLCDHPELFALFKPDEVGAVNVEGMMHEWKDPELHCLSRFPYIHDLSFAGVQNLSDGALNTISNMHELQALHIEQGDISNEALSRFTFARNIIDIRIGQLKDPSILLKLLKGSPKLSNLSLEACTITSGDVELIAALPYLVRLELSSVNQLGVSEIAPLKKCRKLQLLRLGNIKVTPELISLLQTINPSELSILCSDSQLDQLRRALPHTAVGPFKQNAFMGEKAFDKHFLRYTE